MSRRDEVGNLFHEAIFMLFSDEKDIAAAKESLTDRCFALFPEAEILEHDEAVEIKSGIEDVITNAGSLK